MKGVRLEQVTKNFGPSSGVKEVDIDIHPGEFFTFLGPSGCGKTTTLRMIAGFYYPTKGSIYFDGAEVTNLQPNRRNIGMVFQNYALFPHMTVFENIAFGLQVRKFSKPEIKGKVEKAQALLSLQNYGSRKINELSGGQQQRVALARALVIEPDILLLDEPLSNLDAKLREETRVEIKRIQVELGVTTIYVTHDQTEAMTMSDRIMVMNEGIVQQVGTPFEIYNKPINHFVASFIGESNILEGSVAKLTDSHAIVEIADGIQISGFRKNASEGIEFAVGENVFLAIRPEAILLEEGSGSLKGEVRLVEFTGMTINYVVHIGGHSVKVMTINEGRDVYRIGDSMSVTFPEDSVYFIKK
ncbi:ABC transporter ATP-binding protein [Bacillus sp. 1P06AnD]|uniref:ABC transporter ATP-binding protein n=1 Tax=Bacillus sp. 1P06AnD TaxID=3132208 RepID=UPI0039A2EFA6